MKVSIVMCVYNTRSYIEAAVNSIFQQTYQNWELIISDDGSSDGTREWLLSLKDHPKVRLYLQDTNLGYVANKNFAISKATGDYITQNDSDDLSDCTRLEQQIAVITKNPAIKIVGSGYSKIDFKGSVYKTISLKQDIVFETYTGDNYPFWFPPLLVHKEVYQKIGFFSDYFAGMGDDLYWTAKANALYPIYCLKDSLYYYRDNPNSITNVLDNKRKLIVNKLLDSILHQRLVTGTDWIEQNDLESLNKYEIQLYQDKRFMSEQYRIWAAKAIDKKDRNQAELLLKKSFNLYPFNVSSFFTMFYYLRTFIYKNL